MSALSSVAPARRRRSLQRRVAAIGGWSAALGALLIVLIVLLALLAPWIAPYDPLKPNFLTRLAPPSASHWFGTDQVGRDILSRVLWGARVSLKVSFLAAIIGTVLGVSFGLLAAYHRGRLFDHLIMRTVDAIASIPLLIWAIAVVGTLGAGAMTIGPITLANEDKLLLLVGILYLPMMTRVTYTVASAEQTSDYVKARRLQGVGPARIMIGDVLPNCLSPIIVQITFLIAVGIIVEAAVSFIGLGVQPPRPSWGTMLADARPYIFGPEWWLSFFPGLVISLTVIGFNLLGDGLREAADPRRAAGGA
jgi:peptide/nickel transport system permease protein